MEAKERIKKAYEFCVVTVLYTPNKMLLMLWA